MTASPGAAKRIGTGWVYHERYAWHDTGTAAGMVEASGWLEPLAHLDTAATRRRLHSLVEVSGLGERLVRLPARAARDEELEAVHERAYIDRIETLSAGHGGDAGDGVSPFAKGGAEIARLAAGGAIVAVEAVLRGDVRNAYALVRPAGHHALPDRGMGFCIFNNVAIAVEHALSAHAAGRVAVVDWDVHHGNGTQAIFYERADVLTISIHQDRCYPVDSGGLDERGAGAGVGANLNVPLPPGSGDGAYAEAIRRVVLPALERFGADLVVIASGFDASAYDPLGRMLLHSESYRDMAQTMLAACDGRLVMVHEGGYSEFYVPLCGIAVVEALTGAGTAVTDPYLEEARAMAGHALTHEQRRVIDAAAGLVEDVPSTPPLERSQAVSAGFAARDLLGDAPA